MIAHNKLNIEELRGKDLVCWCAPLPCHADILLVTGVVNRQVAKRLKEVYEQTPNPKAVVAIGVCPASGDMFKDSYNMAGPLNKIIPVDIYVPGCPPKPEAIIAGIIKAMQKF